MEDALVRFHIPKKYSFKTKVLILVLMEDALVPASRKMRLPVSVVLILVLMEDALVQR